MQYLFYVQNQTTADIAILCKDSNFNERKIEANYISSLVQQGVSRSTLMALSLKYDTYAKCSAKNAKEYLQKILPKLAILQVKTLFVADALYFKYLTGIQKTGTAYGYIHKCTIINYEYMNVILAPNYQAIIYNPEIQKYLDIAITTVAQYVAGTYQEPGKDIIRSAWYPESTKAIQAILKGLHQYTYLFCDIETTGLKFYNCGISTITFSWSKHEGIAFGVDRGVNPFVIRALLKAFLITYKGTLIFHGATYDVKVLIYQLWMKDLGDYEGMIDGLNNFKDKIECTKLMAYLALNNTVETKLGLKTLAFEFAGDYGLENIANTALIPLPNLLEYNLKDGLCTCYVYELYWPIVIQEQQMDVYHEIFQPAITNVIQMELCGMPIDPKQVQRLKTLLKKTVTKQQDFFKACPIITAFHQEQLEEKAAKATKAAAKKVYTIHDSVIAFDFNPNSDLQLQKLIFNYMGYAPIDFTKKKAPATGTKTLEKLIHHATSDEHKKIFQTLIDHALADKILTSFVPAFENAQQLPDSSWRLYGNFNLGGTKSGRMSSSQINLQNLPSNSIYGKAVKKCFISPPGWLFCGSDFDALESKINALITKDPNKLCVYTDNFDGHCLASYFYFKSKMLDITQALQGYFETPTISKEKAVQIINSIKTKYPELRQASKAPSFALQYGGSYVTLMNNCAFSEKEAKHIESSYHTMNCVSDKWVEDRLNEATKTGYVTCAFGLRLRTPILAQTILGASTPFIAQKERRSAGNAVSGQSYGLLTTRAGIEFQRRCLASVYKYDIMPAAHIHDAIYTLVKDNPDVVKWVNDNLIECMAWQELPEIKHDQIKLSSSLEIYWPNWSTTVSVPNHINKHELQHIAYRAKESVK